MRALVLYQPWASAVALGYKREETRGWRTHYRGEVLLCAGARPRPHDQASRAVALLLGDPERRALLPSFLRWHEDLPHGQVLARAELYDCVRTTYEGELRAQRVPVPRCPAVPTRHAPVLVWSPERGRADWLLLPPVEYQLGDYSPGRYVHRLRDVRRLEHPLAIRGAQGLFTVPPELASRAAQASVVPVPYLTT